MRSSPAMMGILVAVRSHSHSRLLGVRPSNNPQPTPSVCRCCFVNRNNPIQQSAGDPRWNFTSISGSGGGGESGTFIALLSGTGMATEAQKRKSVQEAIDKVLFKVRVTNLGSVRCEWRSNLNCAPSAEHSHGHPSVADQ